MLPPMIAQMAPLLVSGVALFPLSISIPIVVISLAALISIDVWSDIYYPNFNIKIGSSKSQEGAGKILLINLGMMLIILFLGAIFSFQWWYSEVSFFQALTPMWAKILSLGLFSLEIVGVLIFCVNSSIKRD